MNRPTDPEDDLNDKDMRALFNFDNSNTPPALDKTILSAAHKAVSKQEIVRPHPAKRWYSYWPQGFSAAAVVVLAVLIVPTIVSTPESSLDSSLVVDEAQMALNESSDALDETQESLAQQNGDPEMVAKNGVDANSGSSANKRFFSQNKSIVQSTGIQSANNRESSAEANEAVVLESASDAIAFSTPAASLTGVAESSSREADAASDSDSADRTGQSIDSQQALIAQLTGSRFQSETEPSRWITFDGNNFSWKTLNRTLTGTYRFVSNGRFIAELPDKHLTIEFSDEGLLWESERYQVK